MIDAPSIALRTKLLGAIIRDARLKAGKSMKDTAAFFGASSGKLSSYEHGRKGISLPELELLAFHLDIPLRHFLSDAFPEPEPSIEHDPEIVISLRQKMIGAMLRSYRENIGMTIRQFAESAEIPRSRISAYERGERPIPLPELEKLLEILGSPLEELLDTEGPVGEWHLEQHAFENFQALPEDVRGFLSEPENMRYLRLAKQLSEISVEKLRNVAEILLEITL